MNLQPRVPPTARRGGRTAQGPPGHAAGRASVRASGRRPACIGREQQQLVVEHLNLADSVAWRYRGSGRDWADLRQVARLGLVKAVSGFDAAKGDSFAAYALPTVSGEVKRYLRDHGWMIRPPRPVQELRARVNVAKAELAHKTGQEPTAAQLADELEVDLKDVEEAIQCEGALRPASFEARTSESDLRSLSDTLGALDPDLDRAEQRASLASALRELTAWERRLLFLRYFEERKQQDIADELDISQMQVSRVLTKLLQRLRAQLDESAG